MAHKPIAPEKAEQNDDDAAAYEAYVEDRRAIQQAAIGDLAVLGEDGFEGVNYWSVFRYRNDVEMRGDPNGERLAQVGRRTPPIDSDEFRRDFGGGTFVLRGYVDRIDELGRKRGVSIKHTVKATVEGPRRDFSIEDKPPAAPPVVVAGDPSTRILERILERLERLEQGSGKSDLTELVKSLAALDALRVHSTPAPPPATGIGELVAALKGLHEMSGGGKAAPTDNPLEVAKMMLDKFHEGVTIGQAREPIQVDGDGDPPNYMPIIERGLEILQTMMNRPRPAAARPAPPPAGAPSPPPQHPPQHTTAPTSSAVVVEDPPVSQGQPEATTPAFRWIAAVDMLDRGLKSGRDTADLAASIEDTLNDDELDQAKAASIDDFYTYLGPIIAGYPALKEPQGRAYVDRVLADLRAGEDDEAEEDVKT